MNLFHSFPCGDMLLLYFREDDLLSFCLIPRTMESHLRLDKKTPESMIQFKCSGTPFRNGVQDSLRNSPCMQQLKFLSQEQTANLVITRFQYGDCLFFNHFAELHDNWIRVWTEVRNQSGIPQKFDMLSAFSMAELSPFQDDSGIGKYFLERVTAHWHHEEISMERAGLEQENSLRFGATGTMPVTQYYPFAGMEDRENGVLWGVQLENSGAWQMEFFRSGKSLSLSGGAPDHTFSVAAGQTFRTMSAVLTCVKGDLLDLFNRVQLSQRNRPLDASPVYSGAFSRETLSFVKQCGIRFYVTDGFDPADLDQIREAGLIPGVTVNIETVSTGTVSGSYLRQNGAEIQSGDQLFVDLRHPEIRKTVLQDLCEKLTKYHTGYVKFACPASFCGGCDGAGSPMENQQQYTDSVFDFYAELRNRMPDLVMEFCTPGVARLSAKWLTLADLISSADCLPDAAAAMAALDRQMLTPSCKCGIVAVLHPGDNLPENLNLSLLGRLLLSGPLTDLSDAEKQELQRFLAFYRETQPLLQDGTYRLGHIIGDSCSKPSGWQSYWKNTDKMQLLAVQTFSETEKELSFEIPENMREKLVFPGISVRHLRNRKIEIAPRKAPVSMAFLLGPES